MHLGSEGVVLAARRSYLEATRATRAARPRGLSRGRFARAALTRCFVAGAGLLSVIGVLSPSQFGQPGADTFRSGWPLAVLIVMAGLAGLSAFVRRSELAWALARLREPYVRPLESEPGFDEAAEALAACPVPLRGRYALLYSWGPAAAAVVGGTFAFSCAYFLVDAVLARFQVGWAHPAYAAGFAVLSWLVFGIAAGRLATWRLATSVHKEVATGYPASTE